jgi:ABC-type molybdate transport system permease subunit
VPFVDDQIHVAEWLAFEPVTRYRPDTKLIDGVSGGVPVVESPDGTVPATQVRPVVLTRTRALDRYEQPFPIAMIRELVTVMPNGQNWDTTPCTGAATHEPDVPVLESQTRVIVLLPFLVTGFIFRFLFQLEAGAVNQVLLDVHLIHAPIGYLLSPGWAYVTVLITNIWLGVPFFTVLLFSALQDVPPELKEAAMIDGAGPWQTLVRVTLPVIRPVIEVTFVLGFVFTVKVFDIVISLTQGGPANSTQLIATWAYNLSCSSASFETPVASISDVCGRGFM